MESSTDFGELIVVNIPINGSQGLLQINITTVSGFSVYLYKNYSRPSEKLKQKNLQKYLKMLV